MTNNHENNVPNKSDTWEITKEGISKAWESTKEFASETVDTNKDIAQESWESAQEQLNNIEKAEKKAINKKRKINTSQKEK